MKSEYAIYRIIMKLDHRKFYQELYSCLAEFCYWVVGPLLREPWPGWPLLSPVWLLSVLGPDWSAGLTLSPDWWRPGPSWARAGVCRHGPASHWSTGASHRRRQREQLHIPEEAEDINNIIISPQIYHSSEVVTPSKHIFRTMNDQ